MSFKKPKKKQLRARRTSDEERSDSDDEGTLRSVLEDVRDIQKMREKTAGLSAEELAVGEDINKPKDKKKPGDLIKLKIGGMIDLKKLTAADIKEADLEDNIRQQFSKESHLRDEDEEMRKFVELELQKRKGQATDEDGATSSNNASTFVTAEEQLFQKAKEKLSKYSSRRNEEMLSNQMLCGIPEVDLGMDAKIRNIEDTEATKVRLLKEAAAKRKDLASVTRFNQDVVKDMACDYVRHRIYDIDPTTDLGTETVRPATKRARTDGKPVPVVTDLETPRWKLDNEGPDEGAQPSDKQAYAKYKEEQYSLRRR